jgi:hypothetical protein
VEESSVAVNQDAKHLSLTLKRVPFLPSVLIFLINGPQVAGQGKEYLAGHAPGVSCLALGQTHTTCQNTIRETSADH